MRELLNFPLEEFWLSCKKVHKIYSALPELILTILHTAKSDCTDQYDLRSVQSFLKRFKKSFAIIFDLMIYTLFFASNFFYFKLKSKDQILSIPVFLEV